MERARIVFRFHRPSNWVASRLSPWLILLLMGLSQMVIHPAKAGVVLGWGRLESSLELGFEQERQTTRQKNSPGSSFDSERFRERLHLRGKGLYIVDPRLFTYNLAVGIDFFQENNVFSGLDGNQNGRLYDYAIDSTFFSRKPYNIQFYANQTEDRVSRNFGTRTNVISRVKGARISLHEDSILKDKGFPYFSTSLGVNQLQIREDSSGNGQDFRRNENHDVLQFNAHKGFQTADLLFHYQYDKIKDNLRSDNGFSTNTANLNYSLDFGPTLNWRWTSVSNLVQRSGTSGTDSFTTSEGLRIHHNMDLLSSYRYAFNRFTTKSGTTTTQTANFLVNKRVYKSFSSNLHVQGNRTDLPEGMTKSYGTGPAFTYRRKISETGRLSLRASGAYRVNDNNLSNNLVDARNEPHQVASTFPFADEGFLLSNPFVVEASIVVVDRRDGGLLTTTPGIDYEVIIEGDSIRIRPLPTSVILRAEDPLEVGYTYEVAPSIRFSTTLLSLGGSIDFSWISFSVAHDESNQRRLSGADNGFLQDRTIDTANLRLHGVWRKKRLTLDAAFQHEDSTTQIYTRWRFGQSLSQVISRSLTLTANTTESFTSFNEPQPRNSNSYSANVALSGALGRGWLTRVYAGIMLINDTEIEDQTTARAGINVKRRIGRLTISGDLLWDSFDRGTTNTTDQRISIRAIRKF